MTRKNKRLILASMKVYERRMRGERIRIGLENCPLCEVHAHDWCDECPIDRESGCGCSATPWWELHNHIQMFHSHWTPDPDCPTCQMLLWEEYSYLAYLYYCG